jgi:hypothetical protein
MTIGENALRALPPGARYDNRNEQATVTVLKTEDGTYKVSADCDSLSLLLYERETEIYRLERERRDLEKTLTEERIETVREPTGFQWFQIWGFRLLSSAITLLFILKKFDLWKRLLNLLWPAR